MVSGKGLKIGIVNYSIGNVGSVYRAFQFYGYDVALLDRPKDLDAVDLIVMAGVGNFPVAAARLKALHFWDALNEAALIRKKAILGICLGMQLFGETSEEDGETAGFGWIKGRVEKMKGEGLRVPHMGWNKVTPSDAHLFEGIRYHNFYFMHSYRFVPEQKEDVLATTVYQNLTIASSLRKDNFIGLQFHPEKSQGDGLRLLKNIVESFA